MAPRPAGGSRAGRDLTQEVCVMPYTILLLLLMRTPPREGGRRRGSKPKPELGADGAWVRTYNECVLPSVPPIRCYPANFLKGAELGPPRSLTRTSRRIAVMASSILEPRRNEPNPDDIFTTGG